jgi:hypothetical protein
MIRSTHARSAVVLGLLLLQALALAHAVAAPHLLSGGVVLEAPAARSVLDPAHAGHVGPSWCVEVDEDHLEGAVPCEAVGGACLLAASPLSSRRGDARRAGGAWVTSALVVRWVLLEAPKASPPRVG